MLRKWQLAVLDVEIGSQLLVGEFLLRLVGGVIPDEDAEKITTVQDAVNYLDEKTKS